MYTTEFEHDLMEVRGALLTTSHNDWSAGTTVGGAEIDKVVERMIEDALNRKVDLLPLLNRESIQQLARIWDVRTDLGSTNKSAFYSEGATGTPYPSTKVQLYQVAKCFRSDYEVTGLMQAATSSFYNALADEMQDAVDSHAIGLERSIICGAVTSAYGFASAFPGLLELMGSFVYDSGDTRAVHGIARASGKTYLDNAVVDANGANLSLAHLDSAITKSNKNGGKGDRRIFFCSEERADEINQLLQPQQRFAGSLELEGGFSVATYKRIPIVASRYMDKNGKGSAHATGAYLANDTSMYLLDLDKLVMFDVAGVFARNVPLAQSGDDVRKDVVGGYVKTYGALAMKEFTRHVLINELAAP